MAIPTTYAATARYPHPLVQARSYNPDDDLTAQHNAETQDHLVRSLSRVRGDSDTALLTSDGTSGSTIALYRIDVSAGSALVGGLAGIFAAATDTVILGAGTWGKSYALDGTTPVALTADGQTYDVAIVAIVVNGAVVLSAVFGDEAADGAEVAPTADQIKAALIAAGITDLETRAGFVVDRIKIQRVAVDTITMTHTDPAADADLMAERSGSNIFGVSI